MAIAQHRSVPVRQEQTTLHWHTESISPRPTTMSNRVYRPLTFSLEDRLAEEHLTRLDLCSKNLKKIDKLPNNINFNVVLLDHNDITKVEHLDILTHLIDLSLSHNRLIDIRLISRLRTLQKLNLSHNSLDSIDCLKTLQTLVMLDISSNNIQHLSALNTCHSLQSLDASDNAIRQVEDLSHLTALKYFNLHKNLIDNLISASKYWPKSIHTLDISDNEIKDLTDMSSLSSLIDLNLLSIQNNPCLFIIDDRHGCHQPFDYRPYVLNWSLAIQNLDGMSITRKESLKAEWLLSQGKGRSFRTGEHYELVQYLIRVCGTDVDERDDLHLSRIMLQQDLYHQNEDEEDLLRTSDTMKDAHETLAKDPRSKLHQSLLVSESEFVKISPTSSIDEPCLTRTSSPGHTRSIHDDHSGINRYSDYDNRPIKPLDQNILESKLNQYPVEIDLFRPPATSNPQQPKRTSTHLAYNASRYSPRSTPRGPTTSAIIRPKSTKASVARHNQTKRHTIAADHPSTFQTINRVVSTAKTRNKHTTDEEEELQLKSAPVNVAHSVTNSVELKRLSTSIETMRTSVLQAYLDLHERFTKTTELQTSALASFWKKFETQNNIHHHKTEQILEENRLLNQRLRNLESKLNIQTRTLHPPLRAHISKRDTKSFFLHWIPNPLNEQRVILGYRIYIDDICNYTIDSGKFEAIIDSIREEGEYRIKLRAYDEHGESEDSNVVVAKFRRQDSYLSEGQTIQRTQSDHMVENRSGNPLRQTQSNEYLVTSSSSTNKPIEVNQSMPSGEFLLAAQQQKALPITPPNENQRTSEELISRSNSSEKLLQFKPLTTSPKENPSTTNGSCSEVLVSNDSATTKPSPTRAGIMARFAKSPYRIQRNNALLNALPINPTETIPTTQSESIDVRSSMAIPSRSKSSLDVTSF